MLRFRPCLTVKRNFEYDGKMGVGYHFFERYFFWSLLKTYVRVARTMVNQPNERLNQEI
jgi:hypothetical protein